MTNDESRRGGPSANTEKRSEYQAALQAAKGVLEGLGAFEERVQTAARWCLESLAQGGKIIVFGNGGSACEAQHLAGELMGRYKSDRRPLAAVALTADTAVITCIGNDFSFDDIFVRQVKGLGRPGDILIAFSTSGDSLNVVNALLAGREMSLASVAFLGRDGGEAASLADCALIVPHTDTARIQEGHMFLMHSLMDLIEAALGVV